MQSTLGSQIETIVIDQKDYALEDITEGSSVTLSMLLDLLEPFDVRCATGADASQQVFDTIHCEGCSDIPSSANEISPAVSEQRMMVLCDAFDVAAVRTTYPSSLIVARIESTRHGQGTKGSVADIDTDAYDEQCLFVSTDKTLAYLFLLIKDLFIQIALWRNCIRSIEHDRGSLTDILNSSRKIIPYPICITDKNNCVIAQSYESEPEYTYHSLHHNFGEVMNLSEPLRRKILTEKKMILFKSTVPSMPDHIVYHLYHANSLIGAINVMCPASALTPGMEDRLSMLVHSIEPACMDALTAHPNANIPSIDFFEALLEGKRFGHMERIEQLEALGIPSNSVYKVIKADINASAEPTKTSLLALSFISMKSCRSLCFLHNGSLLILVYAPVGTDISHLKTEKDLTSYEISRFDIAFGISDVFHDISDLAHAHDQTKIALDLRKAIDLQRLVERTDKKQHNMYFFYEAQPFYLLDAEPKDKGLMTFTIKTSILPKIIMEDSEKGSDDFDLIWNYLVNERNATKTAQMMYVHRNTVLYRVNKFQEHFDIDLDDPGIREKLCADYRFHFLSVSKGGPED